MRDYIQVGDRVRHTRFLNINGNNGFKVLKLEEARAFCEFQDGFGRSKTSWFILKDLILLSSGSNLVIEN